MADLRDAILDRLKTIAEEIDFEDSTDHELNNLETVTRNEISLGEARQPAVSILEGDEELSPTATESLMRPGAGRVMVMIPHVCIILHEPAETLGTKLNGYRVALIDAIEGDADLKTMLGPKGSAVYVGMNSDLGIARDMLGRMALRFRISYVLKPSRQ